MNPELLNHPPPYMNTIPNIILPQNNEIPSAPPEYSIVNPIPTIGMIQPTPISYGWANLFKPLESTNLYSSPLILTSTTEYPHQTVVPFENFNAQDDVEKIHEALVSHNKINLINILCQRAYNQRQVIAELFHKTYGLKLSEALKLSIISRSDFVVLMCGLVMPCTEFLANEIYEAFSWRYICCYIMITMREHERAAVGAFFNAKYDCNMIEYIKLKSKTRQQDEPIIPQILRVFNNSYNFTTSYTTDSTIESDVKNLIKLHQDVSHKEYIEWLFYHKSLEHIKSVVQEYEKLSNITIETLLAAAFPETSFAIINIAKYAKSPTQYFAFVLKESMEGLGTHELLLSCAIIMRCEIDMVAIKEKFLEFNGDSLRKWISDDTSGNYKYALYKLIGEKRSSEMNL